MLVSCLKILVILVVAQYVTSVEFYKSKRVPPKYKEIRRSYSLKSKEENVDSKPTETFLEISIDRDTIGNVETNDDKQPSLTTILINDNESTIDYSLKKNEEKVKSESVQVDLNNNSDQAKESNDNIQNTEDKQPSFTTTVKPKRRPFNLRKISKPSEVDINERNERDKVSIEKIQTTNKKQLSLITSTITAKRGNFNFRPLRNKEDKVQIKPAETFVKENIDGDKIDDVKLTEEKKPGMTTTTTKPKRRFSNLRTLNNRVEKVQSIRAKTFDIVNADQDKVANGNLETITEESPVAITRKIPLRRTVNIYSLKRKEEKTDSKLISSGNVQTTESEKVIITTSAERAKIPPTLGLRSTFKKKEQEGDSKFVETIIDEDQDKASDGNININGDKKPTVITSTVKSESSTEENINGESIEVLSIENAEQDKVNIENIQISIDKKPIMSTRIVKQKTPLLSPEALKNKEKNNDSEFLERMLDQNIGQTKVSLGKVEVTEDDILSVTLKPEMSKISHQFPKEETDSETIVQENNDQITVSLSNKLSHSLNTNTNGASVETIANENISENKVSVGNVPVTGEKKVTVTTSTIKPRRRTLNRSYLKRKEKNSNSEPVAILKTNQDQVTMGRARATEDKKLRVTSRIVKPRTSTPSPYFQKKETDSESVKTIIKENTSQIKAPVGTLKITEDNKLSHSLNEETTVASVETIVNGNTGQKKANIGNIQATKGNNASTIKPRTRTLNSYYLKRKEVNSQNTPIAMSSNEKTNQDQVTASNIRATGEKKLVVTSRIMKSQPILNPNSSKKKEENTSRKPIETPVNEKIYQEKSSTSNVQNSGNTKFSLISSTIKPKRITLSLDSLKINEDNPKSKSVDTFITENFDRENVSINNGQSEHATTIEDVISQISTVEPKILTVNSAMSERGSKRIVTSQRKITVQNSGLEAETKSSTVSTTSNKDRYVKVVTTQPSRSYENFYQTTTPYTHLENDSETIVQENNDQITVSLSNKLSHSLNTNTNGASVETKANENISENKVSVGNVPVTGEKKVTVTTSTIKPRRRTLNRSYLKRKEKNSNSEPVAILKTNQDQVTMGRARATEDKKLRVTSRIVKPRTSTPSPYFQKKETDSESVKTIIKENTSQIKAPVGTLKITEDNKLSHSLNEETTVVSVETIVNGNTGQKKANIGNIQATKGNNASTIKPRTRTLNSYYLKRKEVNSQNTPIAMSSNEKTNQDQVTASNIRATGEKKLVVTSRIMKSQPILNPNSSKKKEENTSRKPIETPVNEKIYQEKSSTSNVQNSGNTKFSLISSTIKPKRITLSLDSLKINEDNPKSKSVDTFITENFERENVSINNGQSEHAITNEDVISQISTVEPKILTVNSAMSERGSKRIVTTQRKITVQNSGLEAETKPSTVSTTSNTQTQPSRSYENFYQTTTPYTHLEKTTQKHENFVPIVGVQNYVYAYSGDYHYSYEGGDGTKAFEKGELKSADGSSNSSGVVGGYSYRDKDGNDFSLSYTAGEGGYQPVGAHLPTPPPIPPAIQRVLRILATKTTPEPITERIAKKKN